MAVDQAMATHSVAEAIDPERVLKESKERDEQAAHQELQKPSTRRGY